MDSNGLSLNGCKAHLEADRASLYHTSQTNNNYSQRWVGVKKSRTLRGGEVSLGQSSSADNYR